MSFSRRDFIGAAAAPMFVPSSAFGANDRIVYGLIACGGRGRYLNKYFQKLGGQFAAVCDVYDVQIKKALDESPDAKPKVFEDYHELLKMKDLDAVVIASPDHHHCPMLLASLEAGKDVYLEKPLSKSLEQSELMIKAVRKTDRIVQIGMQRRSADAILQAKKLVDDGVLGRITHVRPQWNWNVSKELDNSPLPGKLDWKRFVGDAKMRPLEPMRYRRWRYFVDYAGGNMTDQGTHLMDVVQWFTNQSTPVRAVASGYVAKMKGAEHPDVFTAAFQYPDLLVTWSLNYNNSFENGWSIKFEGDKATMRLDDAGYEVFAEPWKKDAPAIYSAKMPIPMEPHIQNFYDCIKSRKQPNCPVEVAARAVSGPHMANIEMMRNGSIKVAS